MDLSDMNMKLSSRPRAGTASRREAMGQDRRAKPHHCAMKAEALIARIQPQVKLL